MGFHVGIQYTIPSMDGMGKTSILLMVQKSGDLGMYEAHCK